MPYSILDKKINNKNMYDQYFTEEEWNNYLSASKEDVELFKDLRVGLFLHVGISAIGKVDMSWPMSDKKLPDLNDKKSKLPSETYFSWAERFEFENFDADQWISIAKKAGMKYVVVITKHHDGFHMWDTKYSDFNVMTTKFGRDYIREIADACHKYDMKLGFYYSQRDWHHPDYEPVDPTKVTLLDKPPFFKLKEGEVYRVSDKHRKYIEYMHNAVIELMTNYGKVDILWWDSSYFGGMFLADMWDSASLEAKVRKLQPHIVINNRGSLVGDYDTPEGYVGLYQKSRPWETCMTLGPKWSWTDQKPKSLKKIITQLVMCACGDGNYLLSIGCKPDGSLAESDVTRLKELGDWLQKYGESIYSTRAGDILPTKKVGCTENSKYVFIHILKGNKIKIENIQAYKIPPKALTGEKIRVLTKNGKTFIKVKKKLRSIDVILKLEKI